MEPSLFPRFRLAISLSFLNPATNGRYVSRAHLLRNFRNAQAVRSKLAGLLNSFPSCPICISQRDAALVARFTEVGLAGLRPFLPAQVGNAAAGTRKKGLGCRNGD